MAWRVFPNPISSPGWVGGWVGWVEENEAVGMRCCG